MIKGKNLTLRALEPEDIDLLFQWENNSEIWKISETLTPISRFVLEQYLMNAHQDIYAAKQIRLMIVKNDDQQNVGTIELFDFNPKNARAGIGIMIAETERRKSYAGEAIKLMLQYAKNTLNLHQIFCNILEENKVSLHLFQKLGFEIIGLKKAWILEQNEWKNEYLLQKIFQV